MNKVISLLFALLPSVLMAASPQLYVKGTLPNGMTYYVQRNTEMPGQAVFSLVHNVGCLAEDPKEYGVAHFLEHLAFQGTEHFPGESMVRTLERHGVMYGHDINATTSENKTVYRLTGVPTDNAAFLDSCALIMRDWACALTLDPKKIDKERSVIIEEIKMRNNAQSRMQQQWGDVLLKGSRYEGHDVISTPEQVSKVSYQTIRNFYHKWHRPDLEAVVVVGDFDVKAMEQRLRTILSTVPMAEGPCPLQSNTQFSIVPDQTELRFSQCRDLQAPGETMALIYRFVSPDYRKIGVDQYVRHDTYKQLFKQMASVRAQVRSAGQGQPFREMGISYMPLKRGYDNIQFGCPPNPGDENRALRILLLEAGRIKQNGFSQAELDRAKTNLKKIVGRSAKYVSVTNEAVTSALENNYLEGEPVLSLADQYEKVSKVIDEISLDEFNATVRQWLSTPNRMVVLTGSVTMAPISYADVSDIVSTVDGMNLKAYAFELPPVDSVKPLMTTLPKAGKIVKTENRKDIDAQEWILSNGIHVIYKPVLADKGKVSLQAVSRGGTSRYPMDMLPAAEQVGTYVQSAACGNWDNVSLYKQLQLHGLKTDIAVNTYSARMSCMAMPDETEAMFQWQYLSFAQPHLDASIFGAINQQMMMRQQGNPLQDSVKMMKANYSPRVLMKNAGYFRQITPDKIIKVWNDEFGNPADFRIILTGNIDEAEAKRLVCQYIASLPTTKPSGRNYVDVSVAAKKKHQDKDIRLPLRQSLAIGVVSFDLSDTFSAKEAMANKIIEQVFQSRLMENIRQKEGGVYTIQAHGETNFLPKGSLEISAEYQASSDYVKRIQNKIIDEWNNMVEKGITQGEMSRVANFIKLKVAQDNRKAESWADSLATQYLCGRQVLTPIDYRPTLATLTLADLNALLKKYQQQGTSMSVVFHP